MSRDKTDPGWSLPHAALGAIIGGILWSCTDDLAHLWAWILGGAFLSMAAARILARS